MFLLHPVTHLSLFFPHWLVGFSVVTLKGSACGVMVIVVGIGHGDTSSNPRHSNNTLGKGMNPVILPQAMGK